MERGFHIMELCRGDMAETRAGTPTGAQAIDRASALLVSVLEAERPPLLTQLALSHGLAKSTTSRMLSALERQGLVGRDREGAFIPGQTLVRFARTRAADTDLIGQYRPLLERLASVTGETANLAVAIGDAVESLDQADGAYLLGTRNWVGSRIPLHCSALGKVLLAFEAAPVPPGRLERRTPHTLATRAELLADLALVRRRGFAVIKDELEEGLTAVAAPVRDSDGRVIASVSVTGPSTRLSATRLPALGLLLIDETRRFQPNQRRRKDGQS